MVPDLPTPALQWITMGRCSGLTRSRKARTNLRRKHSSNTLLLLFGEMSNETI